MKIESVRIKNFRSIEDQTIFFDDFTVFIGRNGSGKSTVISALNIFFMEEDTSVPMTNYLEKGDFCFENVKLPIEIKITFSELSEAEAKDFSHYVRQGKLIVMAKAEFDPLQNRAAVIRRGFRLGMEEFRGFFENLEDGAKVADLKEIYNKYKEEFLDLPTPGTKEKMIEALHEYEKNHEDKCTEIQSGSLFEGFSKAVHKFRKYIQWVYVPAVKDASTELIAARNTALEKLLQRVVLSESDFESKIHLLQAETQAGYSELLVEYNFLLEKVSEDLSFRLKNWSSLNASVKLEWRNEEGKSVSVLPPKAGVQITEGSFTNDLYRFGHGLQRSYLLALLQTIVELDEENSPKLYLACEEPELYQHPQQIRILSEALEKLSTGNAQVFVTTHSPILISGKGYEAVRLVRKSASEKAEIKQARVKEVNDDEKFLKDAKHLTLTGQQVRLNQILQPALNEMFFARHVTFVEGLEDFAFLTTYLKLSGGWDEFQKLGCHIITAGGKDAILQPLIVATRLGIPSYCVWDLDMNMEASNVRLFKFFGRNDLETVEDDIVGEDFSAWRKDLATTVKREIGEQEWADSIEEVKAQLGIIEHGMGKNVLFLGYVLDHLWGNQLKSKSLEDVCEKILNHARQFC